MEHITRRAPGFAILAIAKLQHSLLVSFSHYIAGHNELLGRAFIILRRECGHGASQLPLRRAHYSPCHFSPTMIFHLMIYREGFEVKQAPAQSRRSATYRRHNTLLVLLFCTFQHISQMASARPDRE